MSHIIAQLHFIRVPLLRISWFSSELGQMPHIDLNDYLLGSCIDHRHILVVPINNSIIWIGICIGNSGVGDKHLVIDKIVFYRIWTLIGVWLSVIAERNLRSDFQGMFVEDVDHAI